MGKIKKQVGRLKMPNVNLSVALKFFDFIPKVVIFLIFNFFYLYLALLSIYQFGFNC
jgi:hypothetical protein